MTRHRQDLIVLSGGRCELGIRDRAMLVGCGGYRVGLRCRRLCLCGIWGYKVVDRVAYTKKRANRNRIVDAAATIVSWRKASGTFRTYYLYCSM